MIFKNSFSISTAAVFSGISLVLLIAGSMGISKSFAAPTGQPTIITLTQTGCQFLESEGGINHMFKTEKAADCEKINKATGRDRLAKSTPIILKPGKYIFRVTNKTVPYSLGFWLRGTGIGRFTLPSVSGGGLDKGKTLDYVIDLKPGEYVYSCPLNPTPNYPLIVKN